MGFGGFLDDAFDWVKNCASDVYNEAVKPVVSPIYNEIKPVVRDVYGGLIKPGIETGGSLLKTGGQFAQGASQNFLNMQKGLGDIISSPIMWVIIIGAGIIIIPKIVDKL